MKEVMTMFFLIRPGAVMHGYGAMVQLIISREKTNLARI